MRLDVSLLSVRHLDVSPPGRLAPLDISIPRRFAIPGRFRKLHYFRFWLFRCDFHHFRATLKRTRIYVSCLYVVRCRNVQVSNYVQCETSRWRNVQLANWQSSKTSCHSWIIDYAFLNVYDVSKRSGA